MDPVDKTKTQGPTLRAGADGAQMQPAPERGQQAAPRNQGPGDRPAANRPGTAKAPPEANPIRWILGLALAGCAWLPPVHTAIQHEVDPRVDSFCTNFYRNPNWGASNQPLVKTDAEWEALKKTERERPATKNGGIAVEGEPTYMAPRPSEIQNIKEMVATSTAAILSVLLLGLGYLIGLVASNMFTGQRS